MASAHLGCAVTVSSGDLGSQVSVTLMVLLWKHNGWQGHVALPAGVRISGLVVLPVSMRYFLKLTLTQELETLPTAATKALVIAAETNEQTEGVKAPGAIEAWGCQDCPQT